MILFNRLSIIFYNEISQKKGEIMKEYLNTQPFETLIKGKAPKSRDHKWYPTSICETAWPVRSRCFFLNLPYYIETNHWHCHTRKGKPTGFPLTYSNHKNLHISKSNYANSREHIRLPNDHLFHSDSFATGSPVSDNWDRTSLFWPRPTSKQQERNFT